MNEAVDAKHIDQDGSVRTDRPLKQERRTRCTCDPISDFGDFKNGIYRSGDALEFTRLFQAFDELSQVLVSHAIPPGGACWSCVLMVRA